MIVDSEPPVPRWRLVLVRQWLRLDNARLRLIIWHKRRVIARLRRRLDRA